MGKSWCLRARTGAWLCASLMVAGMFTSAAEPQLSVADQYRAIWQSYHDELKTFGASNWITKSGEKIDPFKHTKQHIAKLLALAEKHPEDPVTGENLLRISFSSGFQGSDRVEAILRRDWPGAGDYLDLLKELKIGEQGYVSKPDERASRFLTIAEKHPQTPVAVQALTWVVHPVCSGPDFDKALGILRRDHVKAASMDSICGSLGYSNSAHAEDLLRAVATENPDRAAQGTALLALARMLDRQADTVRSLQKSTGDASIKWMESDCGKERLAAWRKADPAKFEKEAEQLFEQVAERHGDMPSYSGTLGKVAKTELFEKRSLGLGKVAPDIEGEDVDGKRFKLTDYRGMVVVIDFWGDWRGPCRAMHPHERSLVKRLEGKPFALLGVNSDSKDRLRQTLKREKMTWRSWWDGGSTDGAIAKAWHVHSWPTIYVLDHKGVIRYKNCTGESLGVAVDALLQEMEK